MQYLTGEALVRPQNHTVLNLVIFMFYLSQLSWRGNPKEFRLGY